MTDTVAARALPDDVLEGILGRLPARSLAASRRVCKAWRDLVDDRRLLLRHLLPHSVRGLFVSNYIYYYYRQHFLARPAPAAEEGGPRIDGEFSFIVREEPFVSHHILDHCNGLVLSSGEHLGGSRMYVCNPTTRRWARLPPAPHYNHRRPKHRTFLVFDPAVSPAQWEVLMAPPEPHKETAKADMEPEKRTMEWPPATWRWSALSSTAMEWEEKVFVREGEAAGTVADLLMKHSLDDQFLPRWRYGAYCQGALYVHCRGEYVSRLCLSTNRYRVIKSPIDLTECQEGAVSSIGRSGNGVCFAALDNMTRLRVWTLNESGDETEWLLKHDSVVMTKCERQRRCDGPWTIDATRDYDRQSKDDEQVSQEDNRDWNSDDDANILDDTADENDWVRTDVDFLLGFHPYKEVIFLGDLGDSAFAYHLNSTKVQYLGELNPGYNHGLFDSFVYTPCLIGV
ncbi:hypothetical protein SETIT_8G223400v2 [Setaria italica]|uniref:F-box domain-containing protein n=1 Tax=Setaria italica TaxID=4555 RepID=K3ZM07_SETIT|nr:hypothetical protein SETIT_8G223400v2 [Setaria italica]